MGGIGVSAEEQPPFDPELWPTWPFPASSIIGRKTNGTPRLDQYGEGWCDGFEAGLQMANRFFETGEWVVPA